MADRQLLLHPAALEEAERSRDWYQVRNPLAASAFVRELERGINRIIESPQAWPAYIKGTRRYFLVGFPFSLIYRDRDGVIELLAIAHHRRRPGYWAERK